MLPPRTLPLLPSSLTHRLCKPKHVSLTSGHAKTKAIPFSHCSSIKTLQQHLLLLTAVLPTQVTAMNTSASTSPERQTALTSTDHRSMDSEKKYVTTLLSVAMFICEASSEKHMSEKLGDFIAVCFAFPPYPPRHLFPKVLAEAAAYFIDPDPRNRLGYELVKHTAVRWTWIHREAEDGWKEPVLRLLNEAASSLDQLVPECAQEVRAYMVDVEPRNEVRDHLIANWYGRISLIQEL